MHTNCAMMASSVTLPTEDKGAKVDEAIKAGGVVTFVRGSLGLSCALIHLMVAAFMAHITMK